MEIFSGALFFLDIVCKLLLCDFAYRVFKVIFWEE